MKFSEQWLREWVNPPVTTTELAEQLTLAGLEVDSMTPVAPDFSGVVVGRVLAVKPHPDAERLRVCQVDVGQEQPLNIVCGAENVRAELKVPVATMGAVLPGNFKIKKSKLRGVESQGMICSETELGIAETSTGIMELPTDAPIGQDIRDYLQLNDHLIDIDLTPNRGDCLSILGVAREAAIANKLPTPQKTIENVKPTSQATLSVAVSATKECPKYIGRVIRNIDNKVATPAWMKEKLRRSDVRSIHPIVDITNYVMLELGQPLHAFDVDKITPPIVVRLAEPGEGIQLLDEQTVTLDSKVLVIADQHAAQAIAGIKGGLSSSITEDTSNIFLESAFFNPATISNTARRFGLYTDSSQRFERGVDPQLQQIAIEHATRLIVDITGGEVGPLVIQEKADYLPQAKNIALRYPQVKRMLGIDLAQSDVADILQQLNMKLTPSEEGWEVVPPSYRLDINSEIDLIEELARVYGYQRIPSESLSGKLSFVPRTEFKLNIRRLSDLLVDQGYQEAITYSFVDPKLQQLLGDGIEPMALKNPISNDLSVMRTNLWPGLISAYAYNEKRQQARIRLFEIGMCFINTDQGLQQQNHVGGLISGSSFPEQWGEKTREVDFYDLKKNIESILNLTGQSHLFQFKVGGHPALHPGKSAILYKENKVVGYLGALNLHLYEKLNIINNIYLFDLNLDSIIDTSLPQYQKLSKFPAIRRDIAIVVPVELSVSEILEKILASAGDLLKNVHVFDVYQGKGIDPGKKSIALGLIFQHGSRTLVDTEINDFMQKLISNLATKFNATLRD